MPRISQRPKMKSPSQSSAKKPCRQVVLVDDHPILREGLARLIDHESDMKVCGQTDNATKALALIGALKPDLAIIDIALNGVNGIELIKRIKGLYPEVPIIVQAVQYEVLFSEWSLRA